MRALFASVALVWLAGVSMAQEAAPATDCVIGEPGCPEPTTELNRPNVTGNSAPSRQAPQSGVPAGGVPADQAQPLQRPMTPEEYDQLRDEMKNGAIGSIFTPDEILQMRRRKIDAQSAGKRPYLDRPPRTKGRVVAYPPPANEGVPYVTLAVGLVTPLTVTDVRGKPWPIKRWDYDTRALSIEGSTCGQEGGGSGGGQVPLFDNQRPYVISVMPCNFETYANLVLYLEGMTAPVVVMMQSGNFTYADLPVRIAVGGKSPGTGVRSVAAAQPARAPLRPVREKGITQSVPDPLFDDLLYGKTPRGASRLRSDGDAAAYFADGRLYVVCDCEVQNPAFDATGQLRDGSRKVFRFNEVVGRVRVVDRAGVERPISIDF